MAKYRKHELCPRYQSKVLHETNKNVVPISTYHMNIFEKFAHVLCKDSW